MEEQTEIYFTPGEFGQACDPPVGGERIWQLCKAGKIRAFKTVTGRRFIPGSELQRFMAERRAKAAPVIERAAISA